MINKLYDNCFTTELNTKVLQVQEEGGLYWHVCKDTIFYKEGGGMASDIGMIENHMVLDLKYEGGYLWHLLDVSLEGNVFMSVNLHERFRKCQVHTAQHLISAILDNVYKVETLSHHVGDDENDVEFNFEEFNEKMAFELQVLCNGLIRDDLDVTIQYPTRAEAEKLAKRGGLHHADLRVVRIGTLDYNLCGCMHVPSLRYLQMLYISGFEKTTKGYSVKYIVGDQFLDSVSRRYNMLNEVSKTLAVSHLYVNTGVERLLNETKQLNRDIMVWKQKYYAQFTKQIALCEDKLSIHFFDDIDVKALAEMAQYSIKNEKKAVLFIAKIYDHVHVVVAANKELDFPVKDVFKEIADKFQLKGGGNTSMAQGGGIYDEAILEYVRTHSFSNKW